MEQMFDLDVQVMHTVSGANFVDISSYTTGFCTLGTCVHNEM